MPPLLSGYFTHGYINRRTNFPEYPKKLKKYAALIEYLGRK
jgi:hypothetical protein